MNISFRKSSLILGLLSFSFGQSTVLASDDWIPLQDESILKEMLSGKGLDGEDWADYYRDDGVMGYYNKQFDSTVVRTWKFEGGGKICTYIYVKQDRQVDCFTLSQSAADPDLIRMTIVDRGYTMQAKLVNQPLQSLVDEVNQVAKRSD